MATSFVFNSFKHLMYAGYNFDMGDGLGLKLSLVDTAPIQTDSLWTAIKSSVTATIGDVTKTLTNVAYNNSDNIIPVLVTATDAVWNGVSFTAIGAVIYDGDDNLVCYIDFTGSQTAQNGSFSVPLSKGFLKTS